MNQVDGKCVIHTEKNAIEINGALVSLRPKTFELVVLLARNPQQTISKAQILETIWAGAVVEDQVVFQSINEIRKELGSSEIIKTYPRKGYAWNHAETVFADNQPKPDKPAAKYNFITTKTAYWTLIPCLILLVAAISYGLWPSSNTDKQTTAVITTQHNGVLILPFNVDTLHQSQKWIRFGAMQGLIDKIIPNDNTTVFQLEDAIEIVNRLSPAEQGDINKLFNKSGASIILQTSISGVPGDYRIVYTMYTPQSTNTRSLNVKNVNEGIDALATNFNHLISPSQQLNTQSLNTKLQNSLIAKAIQYIEIEDNQAALPFLQSATVSDNNDIYAHYLLAKIAMELGQLELATDATDSALKIIDNGTKSKYENRLLYLRGALLASSGDINTAQTVLKRAEKRAQNNKDWLYAAYSQSLLAKLSQINKDYKTANQLFSSALQYQELLQCPMGVAQGYLDLAELYLDQENKALAHEHLQRAQALIDKQELVQAKALLQSTKAKFDSARQ